jgi:hypothetical protein
MKNEKNPGEIGPLKNEKKIKSYSHNNFIEK